MFPGSDTIPMLSVLWMLEEFDPDPNEAGLAPGAHPAMRRHRRLADPMTLAPLNLRSVLALPGLFGTDMIGRRC